MNPEPAMTAECRHAEANAWVAEMADLCKPDRVVWCDGSEEEKDRLVRECLAAGELEELDQNKLPGCYYARSHASDVARSEDKTFICSRNAADCSSSLILGETSRSLMLCVLLYVVRDETGVL